MGIAVDLDGDTAVVGAYTEGSASSGVNGDESDNSASNAGAAYVYVRDGGSWSQQAYLKASNPDAGDFFGGAVAIDGDTIVIGAAFEDSSSSGVNGDETDNGLFNSGAAYVFVRDGNTWTQQAYLKASNPGGSVSPSIEGDAFGYDVAVSGDMVVVTAAFEDSAATGINGSQSNGAARSGAAYVFRRTGTSWSQEAYLKPSNTQSNDNFGWSVAACDNRIVIGAPLEDGGNPNNPNNNSLFESGAAFVFVNELGVWSQEAYLKASNRDVLDVFGWQVAMDSDSLVVGSEGEGSSALGVNGDENDNSAGGSGAAYVFTRADSAWTQQGYIKPTNTDFSDFFGGALALSGNLLSVGSEESSSATGFDGDQSDNSAPDSGAAYLYIRSGESWAPIAYVKAPQVTAVDLFAFSVALSDQTLLVGAPLEDSGASGINGNPDDDSLADSGSAYLYELENPEFYCTGKASSAGCLATIWTSDLTAQPTSSANDYQVTATQVQEGKNGLLFGGISGPLAVPFNGGTLCVQPPTKRGPVQNSGGSTASGCEGGYSTLVNDGALIPLGLDAGPGNSAWYQYWYRDPANGSGNLGTALSNAVRLDFQ